MRCVFQSKQKSVFFLPEQVSSSGAHWPKHNNFFLFCFCNGKPSKILIPRVVYPQKGIFIFCSIELTKTHVCTPHNWCIFFLFNFFHVLHKSIYYTIFHKHCGCIRNNSTLYLYRNDTLKILYTQKLNSLN